MIETTIRSLSSQRSGSTEWSRRTSRPALACEALEEAFKGWVVHHQIPNPREEQDHAQILLHGGVYFTRYFFGMVDLLQLEQADKDWIRRLQLMMDEMDG
jgi:hypothetical protein